VRIIKHAANRPALVALAFGLAVLLGTACSCPSGPTTPTASTLIITPTSATVAVGAVKQFCGSGVAPPYVWSVAGGTAVASGSFCVNVTAGTKTGTFDISVTASGQTARATMTVVAQ